MTISPNPVPPDRPVRARYDWSSVVLGEWQNWLDLRHQVGTLVTSPGGLDFEPLTDDEALKRATRVRLAARDYARRHGMRVESRRLDHGRVLDLRFTIDS